jgi:hypothetical protein
MFVIALITVLDPVLRIITASLRGMLSERRNIVRNDHPPPSLRASAKQSSNKRKILDCFVALLLAMTK